MVWSKFAAFSSPRTPFLDNFRVADHSLRMRRTYSTIGWQPREDTDYNLVPSLLMRVRSAQHLS